MALPLKKSIVIKIGGSTLGAHDTTLEDVVSLQKAGELPVVVHGGGRAISEWLDRQGIATRFVRGLRVTDAQTLPVVLAVLSGLVNKELVAAIVSQGGWAIGLSGIDANIIAAEIKDAELGYVGEIVSINPEPIVAILGAGYIPVIAPVGLQRPNRQGGKVGSPLNINADTAAAEIAVALGAERLIFLTDMVGVCDSAGRALPRLSPDEARSLMTSGTISGGMIPKVEACLRALAAVPITRVIDGRVAHALLTEVEGKGLGTTIA
jgi:acetylglutamate kinase